MKDIPFFQTEYGVASLALGEIPYRQEAYIRVQSVLPGQMESLVRECAGFCRACGADRIYWTGAETEVSPARVLLKMQGTAKVDQQLVEQVFPVTEQTVGRWREIYNERMKQVPQARTLTFFDEKELLGSYGTYFIHHRGELLGIGWLEDTQLLAMAAVKPGAGERVLHTLMSLLEGATVTLQVADANERAIRLYERAGFLKVGEASCWYEYKKAKDDK
jgi:RimJ/RimL family protein N-acetyltransferase